MAVDISVASRNGACDAVVDLLDAGTGAGNLTIRSGAKPASPVDADSGTLLVTIALQDPAYGAAATGTAALAGTPLSNDAVAAGTAGHFRLKDGDAVTVLQGTVTGTGGGGDLELDNTSIESGQTVSITSLNVTMPATGA